jgi:hypothetical protein
MPTIHKISGVTLRKPGVQESQQQYTYIPMLPKQGLRQDTISFSRFWGKRTPRNEYFSPEAYKAVSEYLKENDTGDETTQTGAYSFVREIKRYAEEINPQNIYEDSHSFINDVEPKKIPEVIALLTKIIETSPKQHSFIGSIEARIEELKERLKKINQT